MTPALLDTDALSEVLKRRDRVVLTNATAYLSQHNQFAFSAITRYEVRRGYLTVLSQCNSFLLHRISNDRDQDLVNRLVPDGLKGLLRELPSLPSQNAILLGWASEVPVLVKMNDLPKPQQPQSQDPDFWNVWTGRDDEGKVVTRTAIWQPVVDDWLSQSGGQGMSDPGRDGSS